jgi:hypothetical protein
METPVRRKDPQRLAQFQKRHHPPGWQVKEGTLACVDPHNAGDLVTADKFDWFELQLDYNISEGGNSGIIFHVTDEGAPSGRPDRNPARRQRQGRRPATLRLALRPLPAPDDPKTGKPLDATKPAGEWNHMRIVIIREKCVHEVNGVKYVEYVLGSEDFKQRVAQSKFGKMPLFAKSDTGYPRAAGRSRPGHLPQHQSSPASEVE